MAHAKPAEQAGLDSWGFSSVGRAPALQAGCQRFESANLHCNAKLHKRKPVRREGVNQTGKERMDPRERDPSAEEDSSLQD